MKKIFFILLCAFFYINVHSGAIIEVNAGADFLSMASYNSSVDSANSANQSDGYISNLEKINFSFEPEINAVVLRQTNIGLWGFYLRENSVLEYGSGGSVKRPDGSTAETVSRDFTMFYTGAGIRKYYMPEEDEKINTYFSVDGGIFYSFNNSIKADTYYDSGAFAQETVQQWSACFPGANLETGFDWWADERFGINMKVGYRLATGTVLVTPNSNAVSSGSTPIKQTVDYSGFYFTIGTEFGFEPSGNPEKRFKYDITEARPYSPLAAQFYDEGVKLFQNGNYLEAEKQFKNAKAIDPDSMQIDEYLKTIDILNAESGKASTLNEKLETADKLRDAGAFKEALVKYKEALVMNPQEPHALFYINDFAQKANDYKSTAQQDFLQGKYDSALQNINKAQSYSPDDNDIQAVKDRILKVLSGKKQADDLFNKGVEAFQKGEYDEAAACWKKVLAIDPDDLETKRNLKMAEEKLAETGKTKEKEIQESLDEAKGYFDKGIFDSAKSKCEYVIRMDSGNTTAAAMIQKIDDMQSKGSGEVPQKR